MKSLSRRFFLGRAAAAIPIAAAGASSAAIAATASRQERTPLKGPITPDQYIAEMHAIGWTCWAGCYVNKHGEEAHAGVIEYMTDESRFNETDENHIRRRQLQRAIADSGIDFYDRASDRLYALGFRTNVMASGRGPHPMPAVTAEA